PPAAGVQLRVPGELLRRTEPGAGDPGAVEHVAHLIGAQGREGILDDRGQLVVMRDAVRIGREAGVRRQIAPPQDVVAECEPLPFVLDTEINRTVGNAKRSVRGDGRMPGPGPPGRLLTVAGK